jgi:endonuclease/exonuclease/phosphatase family metal-dependent hydrolase
MLGAAASASAQSTMTINQSGTQVVYTTLRAGSYADTNQGNDLETKTSPNMSVTRRGLLKFDTTTIAVGTPIASAKLTMTVQGGGSTASRNVTAYQGTDSWNQTQATWNSRRSGQPWNTAGGDLGAALDTKAVSNADGAQVTFDVTSLVSQVVSGALGSSRYTRIELVDVDPVDDQSRRIYYTPDASDPSVQPTLVITFGSGSSTTSTPPPTTSTPTPSAPSTPPPSSSGTGTPLRVLEWNIQHNGIGTDGVWDPNRIVSWVVKENPDVIALIEIESWDSYYSGDGTAFYQGLIEAATGETWYTLDVQKYGQWTSGGNRLALFSRFPIQASDRYAFSLGNPAAAGDVTITVNGRNINFFATHLDYQVEANRIVQAGELDSWASGFSEDRILVGDMNGDPGTTEINELTGDFYDSWAVAQPLGIAYSAPDNPDGDTRNGRIDYIMYSKNTQHLSLQSVTVVDTRDANGVMPSDHRPVLTVFGVN